MGTTGRWEALPACSAGVTPRWGTQHWAPAPPITYGGKYCIRVKQGHAGGTHLVLSMWPLNSILHPNLAGRRKITCILKSVLGRVKMVGFFCCFLGFVFFFCFYQETFRIFSSPHLLNEMTLEKTNKTKFLLPVWEEWGKEVIRPNSLQSVSQTLWQVEPQPLGFIQLSQFLLSLFS